MPRPRDHDPTHIHAIAAIEPRVEYLVLRREDVWFIAYDGKDYGPFKTARVAMWFAIDAAQKLGDRGTDTQVRMAAPNGQNLPTWTYGVDPFPPRF